MYCCILSWFYSYMETKIQYSRWLKITKGLYFVIMSKMNWTAQKATALLELVAKTACTRAPWCMLLRSSTPDMYCTLDCLRVLQQQQFCRSSTVCVLSAGQLWNTSVSQSDCSTDVGLTDFQLLWCDTGVSRFHVCLSALADDGDCRGLDFICGAQRKQAGCGEPSQPDIQRTEV